MLLLVVIAVLSYLFWKRSSLKSLLPRSARFEDEELSAFVSQWQQLGRDVGSPSTYEESHAAATKVVKALKFSSADLKRSLRGRKLLEAHRQGASAFEGGLGVRLSAHLNLFAGSVANLGTPEQVAQLDGILERGEIGCFALTESGAGVLSGLVVLTEARVQPDGSFLLESPEPVAASRKTWISNGMVAKWGVVIARLVLLDGTDKGPHAFLVDMDSPGVEKEDMPRKTTFNGLDNANLVFRNVSVPRKALLASLCYVDEKGTYKLRDENKPFRFLDVAQRLMSGRICISGGALGELRRVADAVQAYAEKRLIPTGKDRTTPLAELPAFRDTMTEIRVIWNVYNEFVKNLEVRYCTEDITNELVDCIATAKIVVVNFALSSIYRLKARVGAYALSGASPFGTRTDLMYALRFAEGDTAILSQKKTRDLLKSLKPASLLQVALEGAKSLSPTGLRLAFDKISLAITMMRASRTTRIPTWLESYAQVERIAIASCHKQVYECVQKVNPSHPGLPLFARLYL